MILLPLMADTYITCCRCPPPRAYATRAREKVCVKAADGERATPAETPFSRASARKMRDGYEKTMMPPPRAARCLFFPPPRFLFAGAMMVVVADAGREKRRDIR